MLLKEVIHCNARKRRVGGKVQNSNVFGRSEASQCTEAQLPRGNGGNHLAEQWELLLTRPNQQVMQSY